MTIVRKTRMPFVEVRAGRPLSPQATVIRDLHLARLRHLLHLARQRVYHGARTDCRWHESRQS